MRIVVRYAAGGNTDFTARSIAAKLRAVFVRKIIVENRPGGATNIGTQAIAKAAPDGYSLLMGGASNAINMSLFRQLPYDTLRDFAPVVLCVQGANVSKAAGVQQQCASSRQAAGQPVGAHDGPGRQARFVIQSIWYRITSRTCR